MHEISLSLSLLCVAVYVSTVSVYVSIVSDIIINRLLSPYLMHINIYSPSPITVIDAFSSLFVHIPKFVEVAVAISQNNPQGRKLCSGFVWT